jgi:hypothetical protein
MTAITPILQTSLGTGNDRCTRGGKKDRSGSNENNNDISKSDEDEKWRQNYLLQN